MAQQQILNGETGLAVRNKINENFTELFASIAPTYYVTSQLGITSDAVITAGSQTFGTDKRVALQAILDLATEDEPIVIIWDGKYSVGGTLRIKSNTTIWFMPGCGVILRNNCNCDLFKNYNPTGSTPIDHDIYLIGEDWIINHNGGHQPSHDTTTDGWLTPIRFSGVNNLKITGGNVINGRTFQVWLMNCHYWEVGRIRLDYEPSYAFTAVQTDGLHVNGPSRFGHYHDWRSRTGDDCFALNANDVFQNTVPGQIDPCGRFTWDPIASHGEISDITCENGVMMELTTSGIRLLSAEDAVRRITIKNIKCYSNNTRVLVADNFPSAGCIPYGTGDIADVLLDNIQIRSLPIFGTVGYFQIGAKITNMIFRNITCPDFQGLLPVFFCKQNLYAQNILIDGLQLNNSHTSANSIFLASGYIKNLTMNNVQFTGNSTIFAASTPLIKFNSPASGRIDWLTMNNIHCENITTFVDVGNGIVDYIVGNNWIHNNSNPSILIPSGRSIKDINLNGYSGRFPVGGTGGVAAVTSLRGNAFSNYVTGFNAYSSDFLFTAANGTLITDNFQHSSQPWLVENGSMFEIQNNILIPKAPTPAGNLWWARTNTTVLPDIDWACRIRVTDSTVIAQAYIKFTNTDNYVRINLSSTLGSCSLTNVVNGTPTTFGSFSESAGFLDRSFHTIRITVRSNTSFVVYFDEKPIASGTCPTTQTGTYQGIGALGANAVTGISYDNYTVQNGAYGASPTGGLAKMAVPGSIALPYVAKTGTYPLTIDDFYVNCTSNSFTVTLPSAVTANMRMYIIRNSGAGTITIATTSSQTIDGSAPGTLTQGQMIRVISNGANWNTW